MLIYVSHLENKTQVKTNVAQAGPRSRGKPGKDGLARVDEDAGQEAES